MLAVTQPYLPSFEEYTEYLKGIWDRKWLTNNGPLVLELEKKLKEYLGVKHLFYTGNGTIVLQMALKTLGNVGGEIITTPFSYVATTNAILWEGYTPVFADIKPADFNIDESKIEALITPNTKAILATHVYGNPCNIEAIEAIGKKHNLKIIYDAAHAFGTTYKGKQLLTYGDITTCSFHATKLFHTIEGGCIITNDDAIANEVRLMRQFGHEGDDYFSVGINGKNCEFHAAMGLCNLSKVDAIIEKRKQASSYYDEQFGKTTLVRPVSLSDTGYNHAYYPVIFETEQQLLEAKQKLQEQNIFARRYFYPSLNELKFVNKKYECSISESVSKRALSLPLSTETTEEQQKLVCDTIKTCL